MTKLLFYVKHEANQTNGTETDVTDKTDRGEDSTFRPHNANVNYAGLVSPANAGRVMGVQNGGARDCGRKKLKAGKHGTGEYIPVFPVFPDLPKHIVQDWCPK